MMSVKHQEEEDYPDFVEFDPRGRYGRYNEILGKGASKTVYRAFDEYEGIEVAWNQVKLNDFLQSPQDLERLYCEIHLLKTLKHKNIMKFYTSWVDSSKRNINFITELFTSGTLRQYRLRYRKVNLRAVKHWCRQILMGLVYLHSHDPPVIHRDLKCDNIFINGNQGEVKIGDLGLAAILRKSQAVHCVGTPEFMAPEVYEEEYNELVDIYSFGMCMLEMVTLDYPYSECTHPAQIYKKVISGTKPEALYRVKDPEVRQFVEKCLVKASQRLPAWELLKDPFLHIDGVSPAVSGGDIIEIGHILRQPSVTPRHSNGSLFTNGFSNGLWDEPDRKSRLDYTDDELEIHGMELFNNQEEEHFGNVDIAIKGRRKEDGGVFLRLRITDKNGHVRNIYFPFDVEADTPLNVAVEMVSELDITEYEVTRIAEMIDGELETLVPGWKVGLEATDGSLGFCSRNRCENCTSDVFSCDSPLDFLPSKSPGCGNIPLYYSSNLECTAMHGRFEEITYEGEGLEGAPAISSSHSDGLDSCGDATRGFLYHEEGEHMCSSSNIDEEFSSRKKVSDELCDLNVNSENKHHEDEIQPDLNESKGFLHPPSDPYNLDQKKEDGVSYGSSLASKGETMKSFHLTMNRRFCIPCDDQVPVMEVNLNFDNFFGISNLNRSPEPMGASKSLYTGNILPSPILRTKSLPVDAVDV